MLLSRLRILLIAAAALSTIVAGMRGTFADMPSAVVAVQSCDRCVCDGSREDDSGAPGEPEEEDDRQEEQEGSTNLHLWASPSPGRPCANLARGPAHSARCMSGEWHPIATLVHGPPAGC